MITNVSLDHCDWLGDDVETIAAEKAGVMRPGIPTVFGDKNVPKSVLRQADACAAVLLKAGSDFDIDLNADGSWSWNGPSHVFAGLMPLGLAGEFQLANAAAVLMLLDAAGLGEAMDADLINKVLPGVSLTGRLQRLQVDGFGSDSNEWLIDVAHNPAAAQALARTLASMPSTGAILAIAGVLDDKDVKGMIGALAEHVDRWIALTADSYRALPANELGRQIANLTGRPCFVADSVAEAVEFARRESAENDRILATGSFFTVGPVLDQLATLSRSKT